MGDKPKPQTVVYCPVCSMPPEYCEFGPDFSKCKPWLLENFPKLYPELQKAEAEDKAAEKLEQLQLSGEPSLDLLPKGAEAAAGSSNTVPEVVKKLPGGKTKKKERPEVLVEKFTRNKRKAVTTIKGMELFGVKLADAAKKFGKRFASGASVVKGPTEKEQIDVQGDIMYEVVEFVTSNWKDIPESAIWFIEDGRKVPAVE
eukprot:SM000017S02768  [mRNA]  locus=s17:152483:154743:+ [translate_table: standard]